MNNSGSISTLVVGLMMFVGCTGGDGTEQLSEGESWSLRRQQMHQLVSNADTAIYSKILHYKLEDSTNHYTQKDITKIVFSYPHIDTCLYPAAKDSINNRIKNLLLQDAVGEQTLGSIEERMLAFFDEYKEHREEMEDFGLPASNWMLGVTIDVLLNTSSFMTLRIHKLEFTGGAHANSWTSYLNFDMTTGNVLKLEDLFFENYEPTLLMIAERAFKQEVNLEIDTNLMDTDYEFSTGNFMLPTNFSIGQESLSFHYNPYDLGPFALGTISFEVSYQEILDLIDTTVLAVQPVD